MDWNSNEYSFLPFHVAEEIGRHGIDAVDDMLKKQACSTSDPKRSDAISYLSATIDTDIIRAAAAKLAPISANRKAKIEACGQAYEKLAASVESIDYQALDFFELLEEKYHPLVVKFNLPIRTFYLRKQGAELIHEKISELHSKVGCLLDNPSDTEIDLLYMDIVKYCTAQLAPLLEEQIELYRHFTSFNDLFNSEQENECYGGYRRLKVSPGKMYKLVELGSLYKDAAKTLVEIKKNITAFKASDAARIDAIDQYRKAKFKIEEAIPNQLGNFIDDYQRLRVLSDSTTAS
ncbi:hypothetical protein [Pseudomonas syringae]|uniref:Uncharacterized protein n=1 Tax=Pseudomonas syringae pv. papulans TaxID=83963 RepID=A0AA43ISJ8_PSESX|nr:hypothetical protein [Pseudomonas syringae]MDH4603579.1 hypothetical protein [Pseudomonas syringae pv. papulans]MDH4621317.1 hypothetical protein [Pseudomonas syringae pv. papulans]